MTARLEDWVIAKVYGVEVLVGKVYDGQKARYPDGGYIRTSAIVRGTTTEGSIIYTTNSSYLLGKPAEVLDENHD